MSETNTTQHSILSGNKESEPQSKLAIVPDNIKIQDVTIFYATISLFYKDNKDISIDTFVHLHAKKFDIVVASYSSSILFLNIDNILYRLFNVNHSWYCEAYLNKENTVKYATTHISNLDNFITFVVNTTLRYK